MASDISNPLPFALALGQLGPDGLPVVRAKLAAAYRTRGDLLYPDTLLGRYGAAVRRTQWANPLIDGNWRDPKRPGQRQLTAKEGRCALDRSKFRFVHGHMVKHNFTHSNY